tara:strand:- start:3069 stop:4424 length:1356 start_codon:yes stop_codon:yes gene_type:complete
MKYKTGTFLIIGRPNVGKSTLINRLTGKKEAITDARSGVTRDLRTYTIEHNEAKLRIQDSGGLMLDKRTHVLQQKVEEKVIAQLDSVDGILFVVDYTTGIQSLDERIAKILRRYQEKTILLVNKTDTYEKEQDTASFYRLGFNNLHCVSALHGTGIYDLLEKLTTEFTRQKEKKASLKTNYIVSIVGRPNVGKSSLLNALSNKELSIVHDKSGTTRDTVHTNIVKNEQPYTMVDTAGLRRKAKIKDSLEYYSILRTDNAMQTADLVIMVLDADELISDQDKKIIDLIQKYKRNLILFINKWDLVERTDETRKMLIEKCRQAIPSLGYYPILTGSAKERKGLGKLFETIPEVIERSEQRVSTSQLNEFVDKVIMENVPPSKTGKPLKIYYSTQAEVGPPTFVFFINDTRCISYEYRRFVERRLRQFLGNYEGSAIRIKFRSKKALRERSEDA